MEFLRGVLQLPGRLITSLKAYLYPYDSYSGTVSLSIKSLLVVVGAGVGALGLFVGSVYATYYLDHKYNPQSTGTLAKNDTSAEDTSSGSDTAPEQESTSVESEEPVAVSGSQTSSSNPSSTQQNGQTSTVEEQKDANPDGDAET